MLTIKLGIAAKNEFEENFLNTFGETMRYIRYHKEMKLVTSQEKYTKYMMKPKFKDGYPFFEDLFTVEMRKTEIKMNRQVYL